MSYSSRETQKRLVVGVNGRRIIKRKPWKYNLRSLDLTESRILQVWLGEREIEREIGEDLFKT